MSDENFILSLSPPPADRRIAYGPDPNQFFDLRLPAGKPPHTGLPLLLNIHGGFWRARYDLTHAGHLCAALTKRGIATANLEYRRIGNEGGGWRGSFTDIRAAYKFLLEHGGTYKIDAESILIMGHSAGAQLALCLAAREAKVRGVISLAGVVDLQRAHELHLSLDAVAEFLGGSPSEVPARYREADPMQFSIKNVRQVLFHGSKDEEVPAEFSRLYVANKQKRTGDESEDVQLVEISGAGHYDLIDPRTAAWKLVEKKIVQLLK
jgi:acetyl esterase/lipase